MSNVDLTPPNRHRAVGDDLKREVGFYDLALTLAREGRNKLTELGEPVRRPKDFFCEMVKSDQHMARVKESLVVQQKKISAVEKRKAEKAQKKYAKQVQAEAEAEKSERKKKVAGDRRLAQGVRNEVGTWTKGRASSPNEDEGRSFWG